MIFSIQIHTVYTKKTHFIVRTKKCLMWDVLRVYYQRECQTDCEVVGIELDKKAEKKAESIIV